MTPSRSWPLRQRSAKSALVNSRGHLLRPPWPRAFPECSMVGPLTAQTISIYEQRYRPAHRSGDCLRPHPQSEGLSLHSSAVLQMILLEHCRDDFPHELPYAHVPERRLKRELPDHVLSEGQFGRPLLAPILHPDGEARFLPWRKGLDWLHGLRL